MLSVFNVSSKCWPSHLAGRTSDCAVKYFSDYLDNNDNDFVLIWGKHTHAHTPTHTCTHIHTHTNTHTHTHTHLHTHTHAHLHKHTYIDNHTPHTHTQNHTHTLFPISDCCDQASGKNKHFYFCVTPI